MTSPQDLIVLLLQPGVSLVKVFTDPIELVSKLMKGLLMVPVDLLKQVLQVLVKDHLKVLNSCAELLVEDPNYFFG